MTNRSKVRVLGWNGIQTNGSGSTDLFVNDLKQLGYDAKDVNYPRVNIFTARSKRRLKANASKVLADHKPDDCVVAHSYGCAVALEAMRQGAKFKHVFLFSPAIDSDIVFPEGAAESITVFYNRRDRAIFAGMLLWRHVFGAMGRRGYRGKPDGRVVNVDYKTVSGGSSLLNHSLYFKNEHRHKFVKLVDEHIAAQQRYDQAMRGMTLGKTKGQR